MSVLIYGRRGCYPSPHRFELGAFAGEETRFSKCALIAATREHVQDADTMKHYNTRLAVSFCGRRTAVFRYCPQLSKTFAWPVNHPDPDAIYHSVMVPIIDAIVKEFLQGHDATVHCNSFCHRGPVGLASVARIFTGVEVEDIMKVIGETFSGENARLNRFHL